NLVQQRNVGSHLPTINDVNEDEDENTTTINCPVSVLSRISSLTTCLLLF
ncbi:unnamed protein product, partial [Rotaria sp. Silwood2]